MTIHHATVKRANGLGIMLAETAAGITASIPEFNRSLEAADAKIAIEAMAFYRRFMVEYPKLQVTVIDGTVYVGAEDKDGEVQDIYEVEYLDEEGKVFDQDQAFADALEAYQQWMADNEVEEEEIDDEPKGVVVVASKYKDEYKARGNPNNCGDWLAVMLDDQFKRKDGVSKKAYFHYDEFTQMLIDNGVDMSGPWARLPQTGSRGWQGRYRMNGRQVLEVKVIENKGFTVQGVFIKIPDDDYEALLNRHPGIRETLEIEAEEALHAKKGK